MDALLADLKTRGVEVLSRVRDLSQNRRGTSAVWGGERSNLLDLLGAAGPEKNAIGKKQRGARSPRRKASRWRGR